MLTSRNFLVIGCISLVVCSLGIITNYSKADTTTNTAVNMMITSGNLVAGNPTSCDLGTIQIQSGTGYLSGQCGGGSEYFSVDDLAGSDSGYRTTIQTTALNGPGGNSITGSLVSLQKGGLTKLAGVINSDVFINAALDSYTPIGIAVNYIMRNQGANEGKVSKYGDAPWIKVTVPPYQAVGSYSGTLYFTLIEEGL